MLSPFVLSLVAACVNVGVSNEKDPDDTDVADINRDLVIMALIAICASSSAEIK